MTTKFWPRNKTLVLSWLSLRVYTIVCSIFAAHLAGSSVVGVFERWDATYYARIASVGYSPHDGTTNFHPLFSVLAWPIAPIVNSPVVALLIVSSIATLGLCLVFERLARFDCDDRKAKEATLLLILWPVSYIFFIPYSESTWLLLAVLSFIYAREQRWWVASIFASAATLTRQQGLFLVIPLALEIWESSKGDWRKTVRSWNSWLSLILVPATYAGWIIIRSIVLGYFQPDFSSFRTAIYSTLLSPASERVVEGQGFMFPWKALYLAITRALSLSYLNPWIDLAFGGLFLMLVVLAWREMRMSYRLYVVIIVLVSFSYHTGMVATGGAYLSLPRHLLLAFPVFIGLTSRFRLRWTPLVITVAVATMTFLLFGYFWVRLVP